MSFYVASVRQFVALRLIDQDYDAFKASPDVRW